MSSPHNVIRIQEGSSSANPGGGGRPALKKLARLVVTGGILVGIVLVMDDPGRIVETLLSASPALVTLIVLVLTLDRILMAWKWILLLEANGASLSLWRGVQIYCSSMVWGLFLPSTLGADAVRAVFTTRAGIRSPAVVASIVVERLLGILPNVLLAMLGILLLHRLGLETLALEVLWWVGLALLAGSVAVFVAAVRPELYEWLERRQLLADRSRFFIEQLRRFSRAFRAYSSQSGVIGTFLVLTTIEQFTGVVVTWLAARALGVELGLMVILAAVPVAYLVTRIPVSLGGIGVYEGVFVMVAASADVAPEDSFAIVLVTRVLQIVTWLPWWISLSLAGSFSASPSSPPLPGREPGS